MWNLLFVIQIHCIFWPDVPSSSIQLVFQHNFYCHRFFFKLMVCYSYAAKEKELSFIEDTLCSNKYNMNNTIEYPIPWKQNTDFGSQCKKMKWMTFTYVGEETRNITKLFKDTQLKLAFQTKSTTQNILKQYTWWDKYNGSGIYQIKYLDCPLKYIRQKGRAFCTRYKEYIKANNNSPGYSTHILNTGHR